MYIYIHVYMSFKDESLESSALSSSTRTTCSWHAQPAMVPLNGCFTDVCLFERALVQAAKPGGTNVFFCADQKTRRAALTGLRMCGSEVMLYNGHELLWQYYASP